MKKLLLLIYTLAPFLFHAQIEPAFKINLTSPVQWQKVTTAGTYLVQTESELSAYEQSSGAKIWSNSSLMVPSGDMITEIPGSTLLLIQTNTATTVVDPYDGQIKFSNAEDAMLELDYEKVLYEANALIVSGKGSSGKTLLQMIDLNNGEKRWQIAEAGKVIHADAFSADESLIVTLFNLYRINNQSGEIVWENATSSDAAAMQEGGALGALMQNMAGTAADDINFKLSYHESPDGRQFLLASEVENEVQSRSSDQVSINYTGNYTLFNKVDGERVWDEPIDMEGKVGQIIFEENQIIILPDDGNRTVINAFDRSTGEAKWGKKGRGIKIKEGVYDYRPVNNGYLVISGSSDKSYFVFLNPQNGSLTFDKPEKLDGRVIKTFPGSKGMAIATTEEFDILDLQSGELLLDKTIATNASLVEKLPAENALVVYDLKDEIITKISLRNAKRIDFTEAEMEFDGREEPNRLSIEENGYLLTSSQNIGKYGTDGALLFSKYYEAPGESGLRKALLLAQAARAAYISANSYYAAAAFGSASQQIENEDPVAGAVVDGMGRAYQELGDQASDFAKKTFKQATARFKATQEARDFRIILGELDKENALLQVSKTNGEPTAQISLGDEREANYAVDDVLGMVFVLRGAKEIEAYQLN